MTEFSAAWCLSIVSQGATWKATCIRTQSMQNNFASLRIVEGSAGAVVAASEIKAVELDFSPRQTASVLAFCTLQSAILFTNGTIHSTISKPYGSTE